MHDRKRAVVHDRIISDMLRSMELERSRPTSVLPVCDLIMVLDAFAYVSVRPL